MIDVDVSGAAIRGLSRSAIALFVNECVRSVRRARAASFVVDEVSIRLVDDEEMKRLNSVFRGKNKTTDVLTFPAEGRGPAADGSRPLGDIVISVPQARRQAASEGHSLATEVRYLVLHGIIHAFGFDHETDRGEMNALEERLRGRVGLQ